MPTAIIADDERLMRDQLKLRLNQVWPELEILDEAKNGDEAIAMVEQHQPDFVFLDIRMPGKTGLEAAQAIGPRTHIVFITAYDQYAVEAFERGAVDYVLKPAEAERLQVTVERLKARLASPPADMSSMLTQLAQQMGLAKQSYLQWIQASI
ncbi:MAG: response regulator, partial [Burkholderiaceae bacterium]|nr:response regulator [Burkholderiaceae bacterium]